MRFAFFLRCHVTQTKHTSGSYLLICSGIKLVEVAQWIETTTPEVFTTNIVFVDKNLSYKNEFFQVCKKLWILVTKIW